MKPVLVVRKSLWSILWTFIWCIALCVLIVPVGYLVYRIISLKHDYFEIYDDRYVHYSGVVNINKHERVLTDVLTVDTSKSFIGNLCNYGNVTVNVIGRDNLYFTDIKDPELVENFFRSKIANVKNLKQIVTEE